MPSSCRKNSLPSDKWRRMMPFLPCFFDVPSGDVQVILSISHHTLDPMRRAVGLDKWPYLEVARGHFCMTSDEICAYRERMMCVADEATKQILWRMAQRAEECRTCKRPLQPMRRAKAQQAHESRRVALDELMQQECPLPLTPTPLSSLLRVSTADAAVQALGPDPEQAFWNEISQIIMLDAPAPAGPVPSSPPLERL